MRTRIATLAIVFLLGILAIGFGPAAKAHTEADPFVTDLIAGQTMDIGDVNVWNDADFLYVRYMTDGTWGMGLTHLHVATSVADIPHTKQGTPIPGQFEYIAMHDPYAADFTYAIPLTWSVGDDLFIAAHADVWGPGASPMPAEGVLATIPLYSWPAAEMVGTVTAEIVGMNLVVTFETSAGWQLLDTNIYVDPTSPPPQPPPFWLWPDAHPGLGGVTTDSFTFALADLGVGSNDILYISARAWIRSTDAIPTLTNAYADDDPSDGWMKYFVVEIPCQMMGETAWAEGFRFIPRHWSMYFIYEVQ